MIEEINDSITKAVKDIKNSSLVWDNGLESFPKEYEDDCFLHISRGKYRFCFYNGQEENSLYKDDLEEYSELVDDKLKEIGEYENLINSEKEIKGELTKEEAKVLTEEYEYGEKVGSIQWAFKVAEKEGEVWHIYIDESTRFLVNNIRQLYNSQTKEILTVEIGIFDGWHRKKSAKEELIEEIIEGALLAENIGSKKNRFKEILNKYKIEKND